MVAATQPRSSRGHCSRSSPASMVRWTPFVCLLIVVQSHAFAPPRSGVVVGTNVAGLTTNGLGDADGSSTTALFSSPVGNRPPPRRTLKKRTNKRRRKMDELSQKSRGSNFHDASHTNSNAQLLGDEDDVEIRPARRKDAVEAGLDYWIDEGDMRRERQRRIAVKNRKSTEGSISEEKLREEVVAPYKQNWIGVFSVFVAVLSAVGTKFPELLQTPVIPIPDL